MVNLIDYIIESGQFKTLKIDDVLFVEYKCLINEKESDIWAHSNYLAYVLGGKKKWKTQSNEIKVKSGEGLFVKKGANTVYQYFDEPFLVIFIFLPDHFIKQVIQKHPELRHNFQLQEKSNPLIPLENNIVLDSFFNSFLSYFAKGTNVSPGILEIKLEELILTLLMQQGNEQLKSYFFELNHYQKTSIREVMDSNFTSPLSLEEFARLSARSLSTFRRDFKNTYHQAPGKWLVNKRLDYAKFLLETSDLSQNEIIEQSGFKNRSHFVKSFKQLYRQSPARYRTSLSAV